MSKVKVKPIKAHTFSTKNSRVEGDIRGYYAQIALKITILSQLNYSY
jgi:hypothetical protein